MEEGLWTSGISEKELIDSPHKNSTFLCVILRSNPGGERMISKHLALILLLINPIVVIPFIVFCAFIKEMFDRWKKND